MEASTGNYDDEDQLPSFEPLNMKAEEAELLNRGVLNAGSINDADGLANTLAALEGLKMSPDVKEAIFDTLAGIIELGNATFDGQGHITEGGVREPSCGDPLAACDAEADA